MSSWDIHPSFLAKYFEFPWQLFRKFCTAFKSTYVEYQDSTSAKGSCGGAVGWGTVLQAERSRIRFPRIWKNLWTAPVNESIKTKWYKIIHDIIPTNECLYKIRIAPTENCRFCGRKDTLHHRLAECGVGQYEWEWTRQLLAIMLRTEPRWVPDEWLLRPYFTLWPPQRQRAVLWVLAHFVIFRSQLERNQTFQNYIDFLWRSKWNLYRKRNRITQVGNYLRILEIDQVWNPTDEQEKIPKVATTRWMDQGHEGLWQLYKTTYSQRYRPNKNTKRHTTKKTQ